MTNKEKLQSLVLYPVKDAHLEGALTDRGLALDSNYEVGTDYEKMQLAKADIFVLLITAPNISEGGFNLALNEKKQLREIASELYDFYGVMNPLKVNDIVDSEKVW